MMTGIFWGLLVSVHAALAVVPSPSKLAGLLWAGAC